MSSDIILTVSLQGPPAFIVLVKFRTIELFVGQVQLLRVLLYVKNLKSKAFEST